MLRTNLEPQETYVLDFVQFENGYREILPRLANEQPHPQRIFSSLAYSGADLRRWILEDTVVENTRLENGNKFELDAHGIWLTVEESRYMTNRNEFSEPPWVNGMPPVFPRK
jgi:hypothetical protein